MSLPVVLLLGLFLTLALFPGLLAGLLPDRLGDLLDPPQPPVPGGTHVGQLRDGPR